MRITTTPLRTHIPLPYARTDRSTGQHTNSQPSALAEAAGGGNHVKLFIRSHRAFHHNEFQFDHKSQNKAKTAYLPVAESPATTSGFSNQYRRFSGVCFHDSIFSLRVRGKHPKKKSLQKDVGALCTGRGKGN